MVRVVTVGTDFHNGFNYLSDVVTETRNEENDDVTYTTTPGVRAGLDLGLMEIASALTQVTMIRTSDLTYGTTTTERDLALTVQGLDVNDRIIVTMPATIEGGLDRDFDSWLRFGACHGKHQTLTFDCPQGDVQYPCPGDWLIDYRCPGIVPTCLFWDDATMAWSDDGCELVGYDTKNVTCELGRAWGLVRAGVSSPPPPPPLLLPRLVLAPH